METTNSNHSAKFAFFYMLSLVALIFTALSAGMIIFQIINKLIPDVPGFFQGGFSDSSLKYAISQMIIAAPIFFLTMRQIHRYLYSGELDNNSGIRKWLTYFMLFVSSVVLIGWLIGTLNSFMQGELTTKFLLKAITAIGISATVFSYFLYDIKRKEVKGVRDARIRMFLIVSLIIVVAALIGSLFVVESPAEARNRKLDQLVIENFVQIDQAVNVYYAENFKLPESLQIIQNEFSYIRDEDLSDPETKAAYIYKISDDKTYELCATFRTSNLDGSENNDYRFYDKSWLHDSGEQCLKQTVHTERKELPLEARPLLID